MTKQAERLTKTILYHNDADGFASATVARMAIKDGKAYSELIPVQYGESIPDDFEGKEVFILDFSYPREVLLDIERRAYSLLVLDHHKTAQKELAGLDFCRFDLSKSGAVMTWEHFFPGKALPEFLRYIQDRDLWQWKLPNSREINAAIRSHPFDFEQWEAWINAESLNELLIEGKAICRDQDLYIAGKVEKEPVWLEIAGHRVPVLNNTYLVSEVTQALYEKHNAPFAITYFDMPGKRVFSLRSPAGGVDVGEVARKYGGGGHPNAAGFTMGLSNVFAFPAPLPEA